jgi:hypothetical protein
MDESSHGGCECSEPPSAITEQDEPPGSGLLACSVCFRSPRSSTIGSLSVWLNSHSGQKSVLRNGSAKSSRDGTTFSKFSGGCFDKHEQ